VKKLSQDTFTLLNEMFVQSPGDFLYFLVVMVLSLISLLMASRLRPDELASPRRYTLALVGAVFVWSLMFVGAIFIRVTGQSAEAILPPLERAVSAASILLMAWAFLSADHLRARNRSNLIVLIALLLVTVAYTLTGVFWVDLAGKIGFNMTPSGMAWTFVLAALPLIALLMTFWLFGSVLDAPLKLVYFLLVALGGGLSLYQTTAFGLIGDYLGLFRLCFTLAQVLVPLIVYRRVVDGYEHALENRLAKIDTGPMPPATKTRVNPPQAEAPRPAPDMMNANLIRAMGEMLATGNPTDIPSRVVNTILDMLKADVGAMLRLQDANYADISQAYDRLMGRKLAGMSLNLAHQPTLVNAIERRTQRALYPDRNVEELDDLYTRLDIEQHGAVYFQPVTHQQEVFAVIMVAMPYTKRELRPEEIELLKGLGVIAGSLLTVSYRAQEAASLAEDRIIQAMVEGISPSDMKESESLQARQGMHENLKGAREQITDLNKQVMELQIQLDDERTRLTSLLGGSQEGLSISQRIAAVNEEQEKLRQERDQLAKRLQAQNAAMVGAVASDNEAVINNLTEALRQEKTILEAEKIRLQAQLDELRAQDRSIVPADMQRLLNKMMQEKSLLESERNQLKDHLDNLEFQLKEMGIESGAADLSDLISELYEERAALKEQNALLQSEREMLLNEREKFSDKLTQEKSRDTQIASLQEELENLASDRETALKQRDKLRKERDEIEEKLNSVKEHRARLLAQVTGYELELNESRDEQMQLRNQIQELADARSQLLHSRDKLIAENHAITTEFDQVVSQMEGNPAKLKQVNDEGLGSLKDMVEDLSQQRDNLERELNQSKTALAELERQLEQAKTTSAKDNGSNVTYQPNNPELMLGLVQELRTPMTSISGYIDLLLAESAGILGEMQRKFLQRVSANITRLDSMIDSLVNVTQLDTGSYRIEPRSINMVHLVEEAITNASIQFREKGLAVTLDLDDSMPSLAADEDSMKQVIGQLLTNAYLVSPPDSEIHVTVTRKPVRLIENEDARNCLYVAVQDSGGGITPEDVQRVFARKYKAENPLIQGLGDTGVGMSIAKALVEAHEGRLWVESKTGMGSTFAFAIPLDFTVEEAK
jgi:signal transduction histidine kinase